MEMGRCMMFFFSPLDLIWSKYYLESLGVTVEEEPKPNQEESPDSVPEDNAKPDTYFISVPNIICTRSKSKN